MPGSSAPLQPPPGLPTPPCPAPEAALGLALEQLALLGLREEEEEEATARKAGPLESIPAAARDAGVALDHLGFPGAPPGGGGWRQHHHPRRRWRQQQQQQQQQQGGGGGGDPLPPGPPRRSVNMTLCVPVPSSEHVAEIVGRQGCKIKALRAKTNTYIKTPVRGEEAVFIVTGRQEDVEMAQREILSAAEHFSMIRAARNKLNGGAASALGPPNLPGQTTVQVRVPYRVVGLVVGPKGATVKRIQQQTHTYIVTPSREKEPVFEVTGMPENVDRAREEIEAHITTRTGAFVETDNDNDFHSNGKDVCLDFLGGGPSRLWPRAPNRRTHSGLRNGPLGSLGPTPPTAELYFEGAPRTHFSSGKTLPFGEAPAAALANDDGDFGFDVLALDLTTPDAVWPPFESPANPPQAFSGSSSSQRQHSNFSGGTTPRHSPTLPEGCTALELPLARRIRSDPASTLPWLSSQDSLSSFSNSTGYYSSSSLPGSVSGNSGSPTESTCSEGPCKNLRECMVCFESEVAAALVPCGHNLFCLECALHICRRPTPECPACHAPATQAIPIFS